MSDGQLSPISNTQFFGHQDAEDVLWHDHLNGKLAHGWLISGPQGIGKATLAYRFARALLAGEDSPEMSESHPVFKRMIAESHADFRVIEPAFDAKKEEYAREITVDQAREIGQFLSLTPGESQWRVIIVDSIDALNVGAANAILKILEEPPPQALLLLISHNPASLLPTIRSRCRQLRLNPLNDKEFARVLRHAAPQIDSDALKGLSELSDCSPGVAIELYNQGALELYAEMLALMADLPKLDAKKLHSFADQMGTGQVNTQWKLFSRLMLTLLARVAKQASGVALVDMVEGEGEALRKLAMLHAPSVWAARWQQAQEQFLLASRRYLDYKQLIISFFHSIPSRDGFKLGSTAA